MTPRPPLIIITGPTAAGKSALALQLALELGGEIVSADSMQVYRLLDIGTAKPPAADRAKVPHHLVDFVDPDESYNVGRYLGDVDTTLRDLDARDVVPVVCGGTALYLKALVWGLVPGPERDPEVRSRLESRWDGGEAHLLWQELRQADPALAGRLHPHDRSRIIRGLEVHLVAGRPLSDIQGEHRFAEQRRDALWIGAQVDRAELYRRIDRRVEQMLAAGWVAEVQEVLGRGYGVDIPPLQAIGYRQICAYLRGGGELPDLVSEIQVQTRRFAKRQLTWFRRLPLHWHPTADIDGILARTRKYLQSRSLTI